MARSDETDTKKPAERAAAGHMRTARSSGHGILADSARDVKRTGYERPGLFLHQKGPGYKSGSGYNLPERRVHSGSSAAS